MDEEKLAQVCSVTGADVDAAGQLLEAADGDVNLAISLFFDSSTNTNNDSANNFEQVRAPIAPQRSRISFAQQQQPTMSFHIPEPFAESARENPENPTAARLAALYKPPTDLVHQPATLEAARVTARTLGVPLLVSLYDPTIFPCHVENRDVWSNEVVREYIKSGNQVVFLQLVYNGGPMDQGPGEIYAGRYGVQPPHIGIIDAQTGELLKEFKCTPTPMDLLSILSDFTTDNNNINQIEEQQKDSFVYLEPDLGPTVTTVMFRLKDGRRMPKRFFLNASPDALYNVAAHLSECKAEELLLKSSPHDSIDPKSSLTIQQLSLQNSLITITSKK